MGRLALDGLWLLLVLLVTLAGVNLKMNFVDDAGNASVYDGTVKVQYEGEALTMTDRPRGLRCAWASRALSLPRG
jgi:hypothetical protein